MHTIIHRTIYATIKAQMLGLFCKWKILKTTISGYIITIATMMLPGYTAKKCGAIYKVDILISSETFHINLVKLSPSRFAT